MVKEELPTSINIIPIGQPIWSVLIDESSVLYCDCRNEETKEMSFCLLNIEHKVSKQLPVKMDWWERPLGIKEEQLFTVKYKDQNDPTSQEFCCYTLSTGVGKLIENLPILDTIVQSPELYEFGSKHHETIARFLSLELPLSCEYLEIDDKIIISYYLRSDYGVDRFLLFLEAGKKVWKVIQDHSMKGFSSGAFFVVDQKLIFIRERNEVCIHFL